ncbi:MAG: TRAP transporter substrate-binding protein DctP, partial [Burkholderiaceae bacterium]
MKLYKLAAIAGLAVACQAIQAQTVIKLGHVLAKGSHYDVGANAFCEEIEKATQGRYKCQQFPAGALGGEREQIEAVQLGTQDMVITSTGPAGNFVPEIKILDIPFLFRDYAHARNTLDGAIGQELLTKFPSKGLVALAWSENGFRHMTNSKRPIVQATDATGLKMRT